jgi:hypothetical protein
VKTSFCVFFFSEGDNFRMSSWLNINPVNIFNVCIFFVLWLNHNLAGKRKSSSWLKYKGSVTNSDWLWAAVSHIDIKSYLLNWKILGLFDKQLPYIFLFSFGKYGLLCLHLSRMIADFDVNNTFHHCLDYLEVALSALYVMRSHLLYY